MTGDGQGQRHVRPAGADDHPLHHAALGERPPELGLDHRSDGGQHGGL